jgi:dipeptidyl aminopeptidase/acylaminoacyl peptidase
VDNDALIGLVEKSHLEAISPINHLQHITSPIHHIHGEYDKVVNIEQTEDMFESLKNANKPVQFIEPDKDDYHLNNNNNRMQTLRVIAPFLKTNLAVKNESLSQAFSLPKRYVKSTVSKKLHLLAK